MCTYLHDDNECASKCDHASVCVSSNLRADSLAQILSEANVRRENRLIVMETCLGLVLGALMERMAGQY